MSRKFFYVSEIWKIHPSAKALILLSPAGDSLMVKANDPIPEGKWSLLGVWE